MRHLNILNYALSSLYRRKFKTFALLAAYTFTIAVIASVLFLTHALKTETNALLESAPDLVVQKMLGGRHDLIPIRYVASINAFLGVKQTSPRYWGYYYDALIKANYTLIGAGSGSLHLDLLEGRLPKKPDECAVGNGVSMIRGAQLGKDLILINNKNMGVLYKVTGVFSAASSMVTNDLVVLTDQAIVDFFGLPQERATDLAVTIPNKREIQTIAAKIKKKFPDTRPITKDELIKTYDLVFNWRSGMMLTLFSGAIFAFCLLAWDKATGISADEKQEIGILKAIGWSTSDVLLLKFWEGTAISLVSFFAGIIIAYIHVFSLGAPALTPIMKGWSTLFPSFQLQPDINLLHLYTLGFFTVIPYLASTVIPIWKTAITDPETVMRG